MRVPEQHEWRYAPQAPGVTAYAAPKEQEFVMYGPNGEPLYTPPKPFLGYGKRND